MAISTHLILKWLHILALAYWLGGEWGIFQLSYHIVNPRLSVEERKRDLETAYRIDILARIGIVLLLPIGFQMGYDLGAHDLEKLILPVWVVMLSFLALVLAAFVARGTPLGLRLTRIDERLRYVLVPILFGTALWSLLSGWPFTAKWFAAKVLIYSLLLAIGLALRFIMRHWSSIMLRLEREGAAPALEAQLAREQNYGHILAYVYWIGIATVAFLGVTKPF
jgi:uncharacterized membrane protein